MRVKQLFSGLAAAVAVSLSAAECLTSNSLNWTSFANQCNGSAVKTADGGYEMSKASGGDAVYLYNKDSYPVEQGKTYRVSIKLGQCDSRLKPEVMITFPGNQDRKPASYSVLFKNNAAEAYFTAQPGDKGIRIHLIAKGNGKAKVDSVLVTEAKTLPSPRTEVASDNGNLLDNDLLDWTYLANKCKGVAKKNANGSYEVTKESGGDALYFYNKNNYPVKPGKTYRVSIKLARYDATLNSILMISFPDNKGRNPASYTALLRNGEAETIFTAQPGDQGIRIHLVVGEDGTAEVASVVLKELVPLSSSPVDISNAVNMGFKDEIANDRKGGWTDQGSDNDLRIFKPGKRSFSGVMFDILDETKNNGKACIALAGKAQEWLPESVSVKADGAWTSLFLLHALAWGESAPGGITVAYKDGSKQEIPVTSADVGNWWGPCAGTNSVVAWSADNNTAYVGLYLTQYKIQDKPLASITLHSNCGPVWLIAGLSLAKGDYLIPKNVETVIFENKEWKRLELKQDIQKGSVLDFSALQDAPAGKYGRVIVNESGKFAFETTPQKAERFYGTNLNGIIYIDKTWCKRIAERLAMSGYNSVRIHHYDGDLLKKDRKGIEFDPEKVDLFDYFIFCLKEKGIYVTIDLYVSRQLVPGELSDLPEFSGLDGYKGLVFLLPSAMDNWKDFTRQFLTHVNPYTKLALKDDPVLITLSLINEDTIFDMSQNQRTSALFRKRYDSWLQKKGISPDKADNSTWNEFLSELYSEGFREMKTFVRSLGCKTPITDQNMAQNIPLTLLRSQYDYVDIHAYWDHPRMEEWALPFGIAGRSFITTGPDWLVTVMSGRILGKPFVITEFDFASPNPFRAESGPLMGAYASLQDWDALYRFAYAHHTSHILGNGHIHVNACWDISVDPVKALSDRIGILLFQRGDVSPARECIPTIVCNDLAGNEVNRPDGWDIKQLAFVSKIGMAIVDKKGQCVSPDVFPKDAIAVNCIQSAMSAHGWGRPDLSADNASPSGILKNCLPQNIAEGLEHGLLISTTNELERNRIAGTFKAITPRSETLIVPAGTALSGKRFSVEGNTEWAVFCAASVDGKSLAESRRILVLHLTNGLYSGTKFANSQMTRLLDWGHYPCLVRTGSALLTLRGAYTGYKLYGVDLSGKRIKEIPLKCTDAALSFTASISSGPDTILAYELVKE